MPAGPRQTVKTPPPRKGRGLTFPPLVKDWTVKGEPNWPGAEYTRRTRLKTQLTEDLSPDFIDELRETLGANFEAYEAVMQPVVNRKLTRGMPPAEKGDRKIKPAYVLPRGETPLDSDEPNPLASTTLSLSGHLSKTKVPECMYTPHGPVCRRTHPQIARVSSFALAT